MNFFDLVLLDFDGLLVDSEDLHYRAYKKMLQGRGFDLKWDFPRYCLAAHYGATDLRDQIYADYPALQEMEPTWDVLYQEKKRAYSELVEKEGVSLMPGAEAMLTALQEADIERVVVTHSPWNFVGAIREQNPALQTIPHWMTREHYGQPKPSPECYLKAIEALGRDGDRIVGFEDSPRGLSALLNTPATAVLVAREDCLAPQFREKLTCHRFDRLSDVSPVIAS